MKKIFRSVFQVAFFMLVLIMLFIITCNLFGVKLKASTGGYKDFTPNENDIIVSCVFNEDLGELEIHLLPQEDKTYSLIFTRLTKEAYNNYSFDISVNNNQYGIEIVTGSFIDEIYGVFDTKKQFSCLDIVNEFALTNNDIIISFDVSTIPPQGQPININDYLQDYILIDSESFLSYVSYINSLNITNGLFDWLKEIIIGFGGFLLATGTAVIGAIWDGTKITTIGIFVLIGVGSSLFYFVLRWVIGLIKVKGGK